MVALPAATPFTMPDDGPTVATDVLDDDHEIDVAPVAEQLNVLELPTHIEEEPTIGDKTGTGQYDKKKSKNGTSKASYVK
jgi:hypothetical protein